MREIRQALLDFVNNSEIKLQHAHRISGPGPKENNPMTNPTQAQAKSKSRKVLVLLVASFFNYRDSYVQTVGAKAKLRWRDVNSLGPVRARCGSLMRGQMSRSSKLPRALSMTSVEHRSYACHTGSLDLGVLSCTTL